MPEYQVYLCILLLTRLAYVGQDEAVGWRFLLQLGFIVAAESLVRFDQFKDRRFAEYVLVGTFMSVLAAIAVAWAVGVALP